MLALALALIVAMGVLEVSLRVLGIGYSYGPVVGHPVFHHWNESNIVISPYHMRYEFGGFEMRFNDDGFAMWEELPPPSTPSIVFIGDSFTLGMQVPEEQRFHTLVSRHFGLPGLNFGNGSASPVLSRLQLEYFADRISPRAVVMQLYSNDVDGEAAMRKVAVRDESGKIIAVPGETTPLMARLARRSYLARLLRRSWLAWKLTRERRQRAGDESNVDIWTPFYTKPLEEWFTPAELRDVGESLSQMAEFCAQRDWPFYLCVIPDRGSLDKGVPDYFHQYFEKFAADHNIAFINLLEAFQQYSPHDLFFPGDLHLNSKGHEVVSKAMIAELEKPPAALKDHGG